VRADSTITAVIANTLAGVGSDLVQASCGATRTTIAGIFFAFIQVQTSLANFLVSFFAFTSVASGGILAHLVRPTNKFAFALVDIFAFEVLGQLKSGFALAFETRAKVLAER